MQLSIVIPLLNEAESLIELHEWIVSVMVKEKLTYEILFIDDGSKDESWEIIEKLKSNDTNIRAFKFRKNYGKSQALHLGFSKAKGDVVITMDADLQDSPEEIPELYDMIINQKYDMISGWKKKRYDNALSKNIPSKLFNWAARKASGLKLNDFNCGLKAFKLEVVKSIQVTGEMHRYIPVLVVNEGFEKIGEKIVKHKKRKYGETKFGMNRFTNGFLDLITIWFQSKFGRRPMHLFGTVGSVVFFIGFLAAVYIGSLKLYKLYNDLPYELVTNSPYFYIALTCMIIGTQLFMAGFLGELVLKNRPQQGYKIVKSIE
jgi:glycosyltransferase involved in cell wall biosynthesis